MAVGDRARRQPEALVTGQLAIAGHLEHAQPHLLGQPQAGTHHQIAERGIPRRPPTPKPRVRQALAGVAAKEVAAVNRFYRWQVTAGNVAANPVPQQGRRWSAGRVEPAGWRGQRAACDLQPGRVVGAGRVAARGVVPALARCGSFGPRSHPQPAAPARHAAATPDGRCDPRRSRPATTDGPGPAIGTSGTQPRPARSRPGCSTRPPTSPQSGKRVQRDVVAELRV